MVETSLNARRLDEAKGLAEIFELVKKVVNAGTGSSRAGLMLGLADLGGGPGQFIGGFYPLTTNVIVLNKRVLDMISTTKPEIYKPYVFTVLMHEYMHTLGTIDEAETRRKTYEIAVKAFGEKHMVSILAKDISAILPFVSLPVPMPPRDDILIELVHGFDRGSFDPYIR